MYMLTYCISVTITAHPVNTTNCTGEIAIFQSQAEGNFSIVPPQNIVWKRFITQSGAYERLVQGSKYKIIENVKNQFASLINTLRIINVTTGDEGWYMFEVGSDVISNRAYLNIITTAGTV